MTQAFDSIVREDNLKPVTSYSSQMEIVFVRLLWVYGPLGELVLYNL